MKVLEAGHRYSVSNYIGDPSGEQLLVFGKRSSPMIKHEEDDYPGTSTQELMRVIIDLLKVAEDRTIYLNAIQRCNESEDAREFLVMGMDNVRQALYSYEVRALRRKRSKQNRQAGMHPDEGEVSVHRDEFPDVPFSHEEIESLPVDADGHILI